MGRRPAPDEPLPSADVRPKLTGVRDEELIRCYDGDCEAIVGPFRSMDAHAERSGAIDGLLGDIRKAEQELDDFLRDEAFWHDRPEASAEQRVLRNRIATLGTLYDALVTLQSSP